MMMMYHTSGWGFTFRTECMMYITERYCFFQATFRYVTYVPGCNTQSSGNPLPTECNMCRVAEDKTTGSCLPECPADKYLTADKLCLDLSCKLIGNMSPEECIVREKSDGLEGNKDILKLAISKFG